MSSSSYLPVSDTDRVAWLNTFSNRIGQYAQSLGLTAAEITSVQHDAAMYAYVVQLYNLSQQYTLALSQLKKALRSSPVQSAAAAFPTPPAIGTAPPAVPNGIFNRIATLVGRIKQSPVYSQTMGEDLGIVIPTSTINPNDMTPNLTVRIDAGHPLLRWKKGEADGVVIYVDRRDGNGFVPLVHTVKTNYLDVAALPANNFAATWDYKARYFIGDDEVGNFSTVISINVIRTA